MLRDLGGYLSEGHATPALSSRDARLGQSKAPSRRLDRPEGAMLVRPRAGTLVTSPAEQPTASTSCRHVRDSPCHLRGLKIHLTSDCSHAGDCK